MKSERVLKLLHWVFKIYSGLYFLIMIEYSIAVITVCVFDFSKLNAGEDSFRKVISYGVSFTFGAVVAACWWQVFIILTKWLSLSTFPSWDSSTSLKKLSRLFMSIFSLELLNQVLTPAIYTSAPFDWENIKMPSGDGSLPLQIFQWHVWLLKILKYGGPYVMPQTVGLATLFLAIIFYLLAKEKQKN